VVGPRLEQNARVVRDGAASSAPARCASEASSGARGVRPPDALGRGIGKLIATGLEGDASTRRRRIQNSVFEADSVAAGGRVARLRRRAPCSRAAHRAGGAAARTEWPDGLRVVPFERRRTRSSHPRIRRRSRSLGVTPRDFGSWSKGHPRASASIRPLVRRPRRGRDRRRDDLQRATRTAAAGSTRSHASPVAQAGRRRGAPAATRSALLGARASTASGLGVDAASDTGAFRLYERAGMAPVARVGECREAAWRCSVSCARRRRCVDGHVAR